MQTVAQNLSPRSSQENSAVFLDFLGVLGVLSGDIIPTILRESFGKDHC